MKRDPKFCYLCENEVIALYKVKSYGFCEDHKNEADELQKIVYKNPFFHLNNKVNLERITNPSNVI